MKKKFLFKFYLAAAFTAACGGENKSTPETQSGKLVWAFSIKGSDAAVLRHTADNQGNVVFATLIRGVVNFGDGDLGAANTLSFALAKYSAAGTFLWAVDFPGNFNEQNHVSLTTDGAGDIFVALSGLTGAVDFGFGAHNDALLAKFAANDGHILNSVSLSSSEFSLSVAAVASTSGNDIVVAGAARALVDSNNQPLSPPGPEHLWLRKLATAAFTPIWTQELAAAGGSAAITAMELSKSDQVAVMIAFSGSLTFSSVYNAQNNVKNFIAAAYKNNGDALWQKPLIASLDAQSPALAVDGESNVIVNGHFAEQNGTTTSGPVDFAKLHGATGSLLFKQQLGTLGAQSSVIPTDVGVGTSSKSWLVGKFAGVFTVANKSLASSNTSLYILHCDEESGDAEWATYSTSGGSVISAGVEVDAENKALVAGRISETVLDGNGQPTTLVRQKIFMLKMER